MAQGSFTADVTAWVAKAKDRIKAVRDEAAQMTIAEMQEPGPAVGNPASGGTGHLPVVSGWLRGSLVSVVGAAFPATVPNPDPEGRYNYNGGAISLTISNAALSDVITVVYTAVYARKMEEKYAFVRLAAQNWQANVDAACALVVSRTGG